MSEERLMKTPEEVRQKAKELLQMPKEEVLTKYMFQKQEIERLKLELSGYRQAILQDKEMLGLKQKNERLNNIIKEVREYIEKHKHLNWYNDSCYMNDLLEILDKENK